MISFYECMTRREAVKVFTKLPFYFTLFTPSTHILHFWSTTLGILMSISERHATESTGRKARTHMVGLWASRGCCGYWGEHEAWDIQPYD